MIDMEDAWQGIIGKFMRVSTYLTRGMVLLLFLGLALGSRAQAPQWEWARSFATAGFEMAKSAVADPATGHVYVAGDWDTDLSATFPGGANPSTLFDATYGGQDGFVAKFDEDGNLLWAFKVGGVSDDQVNSIDLDQEGNIYITGMMGQAGSNYFSGTSPHAGSNILDNAMGEDFFLAKYNPDGQFIWVRRSDDNAGDLSGQDVTISGDAVYAVGMTTGKASFGALSLIYVPVAMDIFLVRYSLDGTESWITQAGSNRDNLALEVVADETHVFYIGHFFGSNLNLRDATGLSVFTLTNAQIGYSDILVAAYDHAGAFSWSQTIASLDNDEGMGIALDADSLYITGAVHHNANFPGYAGNPLPTSAEQDLFLASLAKSDGTTGWVRVIPSTNPGNELGHCVALDVFGNLYMSGEFGGDLQFPSGTTLSSLGGADVFLAAYSSNGDFQWAESAGSSMQDEAKGMALGRDGSLYLAGRYDNEMTLGPLILSDNDNSNGYLVKLKDTIMEIPFADPGPYGDVCGSTLALQAFPSIGDGIWSLVSGPGNAVFTPSENDPVVSVQVDQYGSYSFAWTETNVMGSDDSIFTVEFFEPTLAMGGTGGDTCSLSFGLGAIPSLGQGQWSMLAGPGSVTFLPSDTVPDPVAAVSEVGTYTFQWTETNGVCNSAATVTVNYTTPPPVDPGPSGDACGLTFNLNALPSFGTGSWSLLSGPGSALFSPSADVANAAVTVSQPGSYDILWTESDGICSNDSAITINFTEIPAAQAGTGGDICGSDYQLAALPSIGTGTWTLESGPGTASFVPSAEVPDPIVSVDMPGLYQFTWTETNGICVDQASIEVNFLDNLVVEAGPDATVCGLQHGMSVLPQDIPGSWNTSYGPGVASFSPSETDPMARVAVDVPGEYQFTWEVRQGFCTGKDSVRITFRRQPMANAGPDQVLEHVFSTTLEALLPSADVVAVNANGTWSLLSGAGTIENPNDPSSRVSGLGLGDNVFRWTISSDFCPDASDEVLITVNDLETYTVITPNNDGLNDVLVFSGIDELRACEIIIYNRWGTEVYRDPDYQNDWDGKDKNGRPLIQDTYYYILRIPPDRIIKNFVEIRRSQ